MTVMLCYVMINMPIHSVSLVKCSCHYECFSLSLSLYHSLISTTLPPSLSVDRIKALRSRESEQSDKLERRLADRTVIAAQIDGTYATIQLNIG